jgi:hypothetical protein
MEMLRALLTTLTISVLILLGVLVYGAIKSVVISSGEQGHGISMQNPSPSAIALVNNKVCFLYIYDISYLGHGGAQQPYQPLSDLYYQEVKDRRITFNMYGFTIWNLTNNSVAIRIFEINTVTALELQRIVKEEVDRANLSKYHPIVTSEGFSKIVEYTKQKSLYIYNRCNVVKPPWIGMVTKISLPNRTITVFIEPIFVCNATSIPQQGNTHVVELCFDRDLKFTPITPIIPIISGNLTSIGEVVEKAINASRFNDLNVLKVVDLYLRNPILDIMLRYNYLLMLKPRLEHILRALAFLAVFVGSTVIHYRFRPYEYSYITRFVRKLRQRIYRR